MSTLTGRDKTAVYKLPPTALKLEENDFRYLNVYIVID